jgi:hypothetical protein
MSAQMKQFIDTTGGLWLKGELEDKATGIFTSTATIHGGQETTILTALVPLIHLGMVFVGTPYGQNPQILVTDGIGGSPYGPGTLAGTDGSRQPVEAELTTARNLGSRLARVSQGKSCIRAIARHLPATGHDRLWCVAAVHGFAVSSCSLIAKCQFPVSSKNFPVLLRREIGHKTLSYMSERQEYAPLDAKIRKNSLYFPGYQGICL